MEKPNQDGWYTYQTNDHTQGFLGQLALEKQALEADNAPVQQHQIIQTLVQTVLAPQATYDYYFSELHGSVMAPTDIPLKGNRPHSTYKTDVWQPLYDTTCLYGYSCWPYSYDSIYVAESPAENPLDYVYLAFCRNGCSHASALIEYIRISVKRTD